MEKEITVEQGAEHQLDSKTLLALITTGDMANLSPEEKIEYYKARCDAAGLDPRTAPFQFIRLQGKETLYATKSATDQLTKVHKISVEVLEQTTDGDIRMVMVRARAGDGRQTDEMGAVAIVGLKGADLANACMKAITKAKRRSILSLCGLGTIDETEIETVPAVPEIQMPQPTSDAKLTEQPVSIDVPEIPVQTAEEIQIPEACQNMEIYPIRISADKNPEGGFIYNVIDSLGRPWVSRVKADALKIKTAMETKKGIGVLVNGNVIDSLQQELAS